jgi:hypothetical protein
LLISVMATNFPLTDAGRGDVNVKLIAFQLLLDETGNLIEGLQTVPADVWVERDEATAAAMSRLDAARLEAWNALDKAPRLDRAAS